MSQMVCRNDSSKPNFARRPRRIFYTFHRNPKSHGSIESIILEYKATNLNTLDKSRAVYGVDICSTNRTLRNLFVELIKFEAVSGCYTFNCCFRSRFADLTDTWLSISKLNILIRTCKCVVERLAFRTA